LGQDIDGEAAGDASGHSVSLSEDGKIVAIGAIFDNDDIINAGYTRVYRWDDISTWIQIGDDIKGDADSDRSGYSVSLSADGIRVAIGTQRSDINGNDSGRTVN
jgi:hypothetical protein